MPAKSDKSSGGSLTLSPLATHYAGTATLAGGPPDTDVTFTFAGPAGGASEQTVRTDDQGGATVDLVPQTAGDLTVTVTQVVVNTIAVAEAGVSGTPPGPEITPQEGA